MSRLGVAVVFLVVVALVLWRRRSVERPGQPWQWRWPVVGVALGAATVGGWALAALGGVSFGPSSVGAVAGVAAGAPNWWLVAFLFGIIGGGTLGARTAGGFHVRGEEPVRYGRLAVGGVLLGAGGWIAGGCNLGHGLSGVAQLNVSSWVVVVAIVAGVGLARAVRRGAGRTTVLRGTHPWRGAMCTARSEPAMVSSVSAAGMNRSDHVAWRGHDMSLVDKIFGKESSSRGDEVREPGATGPRDAASASGARGGADRDPDEVAVDRYRYMLRTAPPETVEQAHAEAFEKLSPEQRRRVLTELGNSVPESERPASDDPQALARTATRAEMRQPGTMERTLGGGGGGGGGGMGMGGMIAGSLLASVAGAFIGTSIASSFLADDVGGEDVGGGEDEAGSEDVAGEEAAPGELGDPGTDDPGIGDLGGMGDASF